MEVAGGTGRWGRPGRGGGGGKKWARCRAEMKCCEGGLGATLEATEVRIAAPFGGMALRSVCWVSLCLLRSTLR